jgi:aspartate-semialdehyde dehydrogenase
MTGAFRVAIVGAATLRGKEVAEALAESVFASAEIVLLDDDAAIGQLEPVGDEVSFIKAIDAEAFEKQDFVFFAGGLEQTEKFWRDAREAGATVIDLSQALHGDEGLTMFPWQERPAEARLDTQAVEVAHPVAQALALVAERAAGLGTVEFLSATVLEPASEQDRGGMDELHQQTVKLLSFQPLPRDVYGAQVAFNVLTSSTGDARNDLLETEQLILGQYAGLSSEGKMLAPLLLQIAQAPVFHGYVMAVHLRMKDTQTLAAVQDALDGPHASFADDGPDGEWPSNLAVSGQSEVLLKVRAGSPEAKAGRDFRLWLAVDNLRLAALTAVDAAAGMRHLRPRGEVQ